MRFATKVVLALLLVTACAACSMRLDSETPRAMMSTKPTAVEAGSKAGTIDEVSRTSTGCMEGSESGTKPVVSALCS